jgi:lipopolysaccharide export system protein LptA
MTSAVLLAALAAVAAPAAEANPVRVAASEVLYAFRKREVTFSGTAAKPVTLTRDDATLTCRRLVARTDESGQIATAACSGDVRFTRGDRVVTCERALFETALDRVTCEGNPVLKDAGTEARGTRLVYELRSDEAKLEGARITLPGDEVEARRREIEARRQEGKR